ncbi:leucine-rich repeat-containing protein 42-like [Centruroides vittatus]|uniref:leucine-rich repeat-containing protein 42-like n=1 Tax=Centruroides vittatus TaxID=120091 RepID=UPI00350EE7F6
MSSGRNSRAESDVCRKKIVKGSLQRIDFSTERLMIPSGKRLSDNEGKGTSVKRIVARKQRELPSSNTPSSLFIIVLSFISKNIQHVESLKGYPEYFGKILFQAAVLLKKFTITYYTSPQSKSISYNLQLFMSAYKEQVLSSLSICNGLLTINEYLMPLMLLTRFVTELQLTGCHLGDNHDLIDHIKQLKSLRRLGLKDNCLTNEAIRKLSLPFRVMGKGTSNLQEIDISCNPLITKKAVFWLSLFINLKMINIACTGINEENLKLIRDKYGFTKMHIIFNPIKTVGWADSLISHWIEETQKSPRSREDPPMLSGFFSVRRRPSSFPYCSHHTSDHAKQLVIVRPGPF